MQFIRDLGLVLKKAFLPILGTTVLYTFLDQWITEQSQYALSQTEETQTWAWVLLLLAVHLLLPPLTLLITVGALRAHSVTEFAKKNFEQSLIEILRAWGNSLLWTFAFVIPGLIRYFQYVYVPFIVALSPGYANGQEDALERSRQIFKKTWKGLLGNYLLWAVLTSILLLPFDEYRILWRQFPVSWFLMLLEMLFTLVLSVKILNLFERGSR